jgi:hypothetical protein
VSSGLSLHEQACTVCLERLGIKDKKLLTAEQYVDALYQKHAPKYALGLVKESPRLSGLLTKSPNIRKRSHGQEEGGDRE